MQSLSLTLLWAESKPSQLHTSQDSHTMYKASQPAADFTKLYANLRNYVSPLVYGASGAINVAQVDLRSCAKFCEIGCSSNSGGRKGFKVTHYIGKREIINVHKSANL